MTATRTYAQRGHRSHFDLIVAKYELSEKARTAGGRLAGAEGRPISKWSNG